MNALTSVRWLKCWRHCCSRALALAVVFILAGTHAFAQATVTTLANTYNRAGAGSAPAVPVGVTTTGAKFNFPAGIALDPSGTYMFVADNKNNAIRYIYGVGNPSSSVTFSIYNNKNGVNHPIGVAVDSSTNVYVLNYGKTGKDGSLMVFNAATLINYFYIPPIATRTTKLTNAAAITLDNLNNAYITVQGNRVIRVTPSGVTTTVGIIKTGKPALTGIAYLSNGTLAISDAGNNGIWIMDPANTNLLGNAVQLTGFHGAGDTNGAPSVASFNHPEGIIQGGNSILVVADCYNNQVKLVNTTNGNVTRLFGVPSYYWKNAINLATKGWNDGTVNPVEFLDTVQSRQPYGLALGPGGTVYDTEIYYDLLREATGTGLPPIPPPPPTAPTITLVTTNIGQVTLTWTPVSGATNYNVKRSSYPATNGPFTTIATTTNTTYTDTTVMGGVTYYYVVSAVNAGGESPDSAIVSATPPLPPVPDPQIGYVTFPSTASPTYTSVFTPVSPGFYYFNNDAYIVVKGTAGTLTYYTSDGTTPSTTNSSTQSVASDYVDGLLYPSLLVPYEPQPQVAPSLTIQAVGISTNRPNSAVVQAIFYFVTGTPNISGDNAAQFTVGDITVGAQYRYTTDGSDPRTNINATLVGPTFGTNSLTLSLPFPANTNSMLFQIVAVKANYQTSAVVSKVFSSANFVANTISFGFASGEASSQFLGSPGQTFYAPVTLTTLSGVKMYSLQFNLTVTNLGAAPNPTPGAYGFQSMLMQPIVPVPTNYPPGFALYTPIPPYMFANGGFTNLEFTNTSLNLLGVGWLERYAETNLYNTLSQTLISFSMAHDDLFPTPQNPNGVIVGGYSFTIPTAATNGQQYQIQIARASATDDGVGAPGHGVAISAPTNGATSSGAPINALKYVTITNQLKYLVGDVYSFRWFNAGDFGYGDLSTYGSGNAEQVFEAAIYSLNYPPYDSNSWNGTGYTNVSDFFDAMDSCGNIGVLDGNSSDPNFGYYTNSYASLNAAQLNALFIGDDSTINQVAFGDGQLDVCDVYVTYRRSLDSTLTWYRRFWNNGQRVADTGIANHIAIKHASQPNIVAHGSAVPPQVNFAATDSQGASGQTVQVPITANILGIYPLRLLMLNLTVEPLNGAPALTTPVGFTQTATVLGSPLKVDSIGNGNYSSVWINSTNSGLSNSVTIGTLNVTLPAHAPAGAVYAVHFDHASASPNGLASFPKQTLTGLLTCTGVSTGKITSQSAVTADPSYSTFRDGIPDTWRFRYFGGINELTRSNSCATTDGVNNWMKYVAGVDPTIANNFPSTKAKNPLPPGITSAIHWPTVLNKQYVIERSSSLYSGWTAIATNTGTGADVEFDDTNSTSMKFYRVEILP